MLTARLPRDHASLGPHLPAKHGQPIPRKVINATPPAAPGVSPGSPADYAREVKVNVVLRGLRRSS